MSSWRPTSKTPPLKGKDNKRSERVRALARAAKEAAAWQGPTPDEFEEILWRSIMGEPINKLVPEVCNATDRQWIVWLNRPKNERMLAIYHRSKRMKAMWHAEQAESILEYAGGDDDSPTKVARDKFRFDGYKSIAALLDPENYGTKSTIEHKHSALTDDEIRERLRDFAARGGGTIITQGSGEAGAAAEPEGDS